MLCLWICLNFHVFFSLRRILETPLLSLAPHLSDLPTSLAFKASRQLPTLLQLDLCRNCASSPSPKLPFLFFQQNPKKPNQIKPQHLIPSLKSAFTIGHLSLIDYLFPRLTWREPSPVLVGLARRLSVVWCWPWNLAFQPEANLGPNSCITILSLVTWRGKMGNHCLILIKDSIVCIVRYQLR